MAPKMSPTIDTTGLNRNKETSRHWYRKRRRSQTPPVPTQAQSEPDPERVTSNNSRTDILYRTFGRLLCPGILPCPGLPTIDHAPTPPSSPSDTNTETERHETRNYAPTSVNWPLLVEGFYPSERAPPVPSFTDPLRLSLTSQVSSFTDPLRVGFADRFAKSLTHSRNPNDTTTISGGSAILRFVHPDRKEPELQILLVKEMTNRNKSCATIGKYSLPKGKGQFLPEEQHSTTEKRIRRVESYNTIAIRETYEETGIDLAKELKSDNATIIGKRNDGPLTIVVYMIKGPTPTVSVCPFELEWAGWVPVKDLMEVFKESLDNYEYNRSVRLFVKWYRKNGSRLALGSE